MKALVEKDLVKMEDFCNNQKNLDYANLLTPSGIKSKAVLKAHFLVLKAAKYSAFKSELEKISETLRKAEEVGSDAHADPLKDIKLIQVPALENQSTQSAYEMNAIIKMKSLFGQSPVGTARKSTQIWAISV